MFAFCKAIDFDARVCMCVWSHGVNGPECAKHVRNLDVNDVRMEMYFEVFKANAALNKQDRTF